MNEEKTLETVEVACEIPTNLPGCPRTNYVDYKSRTKFHWTKCHKDIMLRGQRNPGQKTTGQKTTGQTTTKNANPGHKTTRTKDRLCHIMWDSHLPGLSQNVGFRASEA